MYQNSWQLLNGWSKHRLVGYIPNRKIPSIPNPFRSSRSDQNSQTFFPPSLSKRSISAACQSSAICSFRRSTGPGMGSKLKIWKNQKYHSTPNFTLIPNISKFLPISQFRNSPPTPPHTSTYNHAEGFRRGGGQNENGKKAKIPFDSKFYADSESIKILAHFPNSSSIPNHPNFSNVDPNNSGRGASRRVSQGI